MLGRLIALYALWRACRPLPSQHRYVIWNDGAVWRVPSVEDYPVWGPNRPYAVAITKKERSGALLWSDGSVSAW